MVWATSNRRASLPRNWPAIVRRIKRRDGYRCTTVFETTGRCTQPGTDVDHIVPASLGGSNEDSNLTLLCRWCHDRKSAREGGTAAGLARVRTQRPPTTHPALEDD
ncbi:HNH endonuclease [Streptomyces sp. NPDC056697]|uniref:HNH endonuclease n=1 Tax=Streptomyces sp. NPDC056697 TaxID=3345915 RepID=UPI0036828049